MNEWHETVLGNVCQNIVTGGTPLTTNSEYYENGSIPWLKTKEVNFCRINKTESHISESGLKNSSAKIIPPFSVIVAMYGQGDTAGRVAVNTIPLATNQACCNLVIDKNKADYQFIYYYLKNSYEELVQRKTGSAQPNLNTKLLKEFEVIIPPLPEQKAIASVLSSLDDKIDLLHRQNKTLEAMAETLFRQWFGEEAQKDWKDGILGDVLELIYGRALKENIRTGSGFPVVGSSGIVGHHAEYLVEGPGIVIGRKGTLGKVTYLFENFFPIDTTYYIKSKVNSAGMLYEYCLLKTLSFENSDSAVPGLNRDIALAEEIKIPPQNLIEEFNNICAGFFSKMKVNINQIRTLETLRDTLLPKLMSGEVRVTV